MDTIFSTVDELLKPSEALIADVARLDGDILILGVGGKIGPSLAKLAKQAVDASGVPRRVIGVSRLSEPGLREELEAAGVEAIAADLLNEADLASLPDAKYVLYLAGTKFGTTGKEAFTWAMNTYLPGRVAENTATRKSSYIPPVTCILWFPYSPAVQTKAWPRSRWRIRTILPWPRTHLRTLLPAIWHRIADVPPQLRQ